MDIDGSRLAPLATGATARRIATAAGVGLLLALSAGGVRASDDALGAKADAVLNAVRARAADCGGGPTTVASGAPGAGAAPERSRLRWNPLLAQAAARHSGAMARTRLFDHVGPDGTTVRERVSATGYRWQLIGENLAAGHADLDEAVAGWMASRSHCAALLDARYTEFGLARIESDSPNDAYGVYWTLVLGRPR
ncbi:MAG: CAP domain-containing protein [Burkholderiales bacterium]|jgi:hypothetical protein